jgi:CRP-like cAMP-binding protein
MNFLVAGFDFGERALVTNEPRSATVMTITPTDLLVVDREVFSRYVKNIEIFFFLIFI